MSAARDLLDRLAEIGATVHPAGEDRLLLRAGANPVPGEMVQRLREVKAEVLAALAPTGHGPKTQGLGIAEGGWWRREFLVRTINRQLAGTRLDAVASRLAFGDMILEWHGRHGIRPDPDRCAGCGEELSDDTGIIVDRDGVRVHFDATRRVDCLIAYGLKWRGAAVAGLLALGISPPDDFKLI